MNLALKPLGALPTVLMLAAAAAVSLTPPNAPVPLRGELATLPRSIVGLTAVDDSIAREKMRSAGDPLYVSRRYVDERARVHFTLYVAYYDAQRQEGGYHSPRACLPGSGWEPIRRDGTTIPLGSGRSGRATRFLVGQGRHRALVYYWFQGRGQMTGDESVAKARLLLAGLVLRRTDEAVVRLVFPLGDIDAGPLAAREARTDSIARVVGERVAEGLEGLLQPAAN